MMRRKLKKVCDVFFCYRIKTLDGKLVEGDMIPMFSI